MNGMKKNSFILRILSLFTISIALLTGCSLSSHAYTYPNLSLPISSLTPPQDAKLFVEGNTSSIDDSSTYIVRKLASVLAIDKGEEILGLLYDENFDTTSTFTFRVYPAIYIFDSSSILGKNTTGFSAKKVIEAEKGYKIINADFNTNWIVWSEASSDRWKAYRLNRNTNEKKLVAQGQLLKLANDDLPVIAICENYAVLNVNDKGTTKVLLYDFTNDTAKTLDQSNEKQEYFGPPSLYEDNVVWHTRDMSNGKSKVSSYNMITEKVNALSTEKSNADYPAIWENYVVWISPTNDKSQETLSVYDLNTGEIIFDTVLQIEDQPSFYRPSIANGKFAWYDLKASSTDGNLKYYNLKTQETKTFKVADILDGIFAPNNLEVHNSWISYIHPLDRIPPPEHHTRIVGSLLWRMTD